MTEADTRSEHLLEMVRENKGYGSGPMGTHRTVFTENLCGSRLLMNLPVSIGASCILWALTIFCMADPTLAKTELKSWQGQVTNFFTWGYIGTNGVWAFFIIGIYFFFGKVRLGKDGEKPQFDDANYFMMIFCAGVGIGLIFYGAAEPLWHYQDGSNRYNNAGYLNDNEKATQAINLTLYHWGVHGWVVYTLTALCLGVLSYRYDLPLTYRTCFFPLFGKATWGWVGDVIDSMTIAGCVAGVCTSLGMGAAQIVTGLARMGMAGFPLGMSEDETVGRRVLVIVVITLAATGSVLSGLDKGIQLLSQVAFGCGMFLWTVCLSLDNTWYLLNLMVQSFGVYVQWIIELGWYTDAFAQLKFGAGRTAEVGTDGTTLVGANPSWMDWWTIFYWGWWIAWSPFVGVFLARISRGRTVAEVINYTFSVPLVYCIMWFSVFGGAGIKMHREAELLEQAGKELHGNKDYYLDLNLPHTTNRCFQVPATMPCPADMVTAETCPPYTDAAWKPDTRLSPVCTFSGSNKGDDIWFDLMDHYAGVGGFLSAFSIITIVVYFVTSSDSGSMVVDLIACNGEDAHPITKVYWAFTEGAVACGLLIAGGSTALGALQAVSICAGVPFTGFVSLICISMVITFKYDQGWSKKGDFCPWAVGLHGGIFDYLEWIFSAFRAPKPDPQSILGFFICLFCPPFYMLQALQRLKGVQGGGPLSKINLACFVGAAIGWFGFIVLLIFSFIFPETGLGGIAVFCYGFFGIWVVSLRSVVRTAYRIEGGMITDFFAGYFIYPQVIYQAFKQCQSPIPEPRKNEPQPEVIGNNKVEKDEPPYEESL